MEIPGPQAFKVEASAQVTGAGEITIFLIGQPPGQPLQVLAHVVFKGRNNELLLELARQAPGLVAKIGASQSGLSLASGALAPRLRQ